VDRHRFLNAPSGFDPSPRQNPVAAVTRPRPHFRDEPITASLPDGCIRNEDRTVIRILHYA